MKIYFNSISVKKKTSTDSVVKCLRKSWNIFIWILHIKKKIRERASTFSTDKVMISIRNGLDTSFNYKVAPCGFQNWQKKTNTKNFFWCNPGNMFLRLNSDKSIVLADNIILDKSQIWADKSQFASTSWFLLPTEKKITIYNKMPGYK